MSILIHIHFQSLLYRHVTYAILYSILNKHEDGVYFSIFPYQYQKYQVLVSAWSPFALRAFISRPALPSGPGAGSVAEALLGWTWRYSDSPHLVNHVTRQQLGTTSHESFVEGPV